VSTPTSTPGRTIGGRYALQSTIGAGGMGTVWRAFDQVLRRQVAVKEVLLPPGVPPAERTLLCERTLREARAAASLNVASVVTIYDVVEEDDRPWIVMELLAARSLSEIIRADGPQPPMVVADIGLQVLSALAAAHKAGILHRDVKPGNILVASDGRATLTDFGVARTIGDSALTSTGLLLGSPCYISPERARGREPGPASDLWSLGAALYAAVEGRPPFDLGDPLPTLTAIVTDPPEPCRLAGPLTEVLGGLLEKDPRRRWNAERASTGFRSAQMAARDRDPLSRMVEHANATRVLDPLRSVQAPIPPGPRHPVGAPPARDQQVPAQARPARTCTAPRRGASAWRMAALVVASIVLMAAAAAAAYFFGPDLLPRHGTPAKRSTVTTIPAGYRLYTAPSGFSILVPKGWRQTPNGRSVDFKDLASRRFLRLTVSKAGGHDIMPLLAANDRANDGHLRGYRKVSIQPAQVGGRPGADWEFTHTYGGDRHVIERSLVLNDTWYEFYLSTREAQFGQSRAIIGTVADSFKPVP
jgi:hypothetical protein